MSDFKQLTAGQLHSWSDTKVLESNNIHVEKGSRYEGLFSMLEQGRFDYFPRSVLEVRGEYEKNKSLDIAIDPYSVIHYPTAYYFYVSKEKTTLAEDIYLGLEKSIADGSFEMIFSEYYGDIVARVGSEKRYVFQLKNPYLPPLTPLKRKELWLDFSER